jgi:SAM-dependent methyltransferase
MNSLDVTSMIDTDVPVYTKFPQTESEEKQRELDRLNEIAGRDGWQSALREIYGSHDYITHPVRYKFLDILPLHKEDTILEVGAQHGQITTELARRVGFVHALEVVPGYARFAAVRCLQEGLRNVEVGCGVDDCQLPYTDEKFDGVVLNLVLEWCGARDPSTPHVESQSRLLRECWRVLRPGGWIYLMTKNRFGMVLLHGVHDTHTFDWRFGQALPRWLLAVLIRLRKKPRPAGMLHSYSALRRIVLEAGFSNVQPYWAVPDTSYRFPTEFIRGDAKAIRAARKRPDFVQGSYAKAEIMFRLTPAPLIKYLTSSLIFFAGKPGRPD